MGLQMALQPTGQQTEDQGPVNDKQQQGQEEIMTAIIKVEYPTSYTDRDVVRMVCCLCEIPLTNGVRAEGYEHRITIISGEYRLFHCGRICKACLNNEIERFGRNTL